MRIRNITVSKDGLSFVKDSRRVKNETITIRFPLEILEWIKCEKNRRVLLSICNLPSLKKRIENPMSLKSLVLLLYSIAKNTPPYKVALKFGVHPEQLYRHRRAILSIGLYDALTMILEERC
ncbi:MAG: hypothetical protein GSR79_02505 [Desulfurococcales archaeon]|nr:hypothetical protein [Desulfurococcales archaeon]